MAKLVVVRNDPVDGTDTHPVTGQTNTNPPATYAGTGEYGYQGAVTEGLSDFVTVGGAAVALVTSTSTLRQDGTSAHEAASGKNFTAPPPITSTLEFVSSKGVGDGTPSEGAGSTLLTAGGQKVLLHGDSFDTCGIDGGKASSTVAADGQDLLTCSE
jgi:hypothetical protein